MARALRQDARFQLMDLLRTLAATAVVLNHARDLLLQDYQSHISSYSLKAFYFATGLGHSAVMIFFVLSGYWITSSVYSDLVEGTWSWRTYLIARITRLWTVLLPALIIGGLCDLAGRYWLHLPIYLGTSGSHVLNFDVATRLNYRDAIGSILFVENVITAPFGSNSALWSLANEFWYYIWFPGLLVFWRSKNATSFLFLIAALATMYLFNQLLPGFLCWLIGAILFHISRIARVMDLCKKSHILTCASLLFVGSIVVSRISVISQSASDFCLSVTFASWLLAMMSRDLGYLHMKSLVWYGRRASFSLYAIHLPILLLLVGSFKQVRLSASFTGVGFCVALTALMAFVAAIFARYTEAYTARLRSLVERIIRLPDQKLALPHPNGATGEAK